MWTESAEFQLAGDVINITSCNYSAVEAFMKKLWNFIKLQQWNKSYSF